MKMHIPGLIMGVLLATSAQASSSFQDWTSAKQENGRCVAMSSPTESVGGIAAREAPYVAIMNSPTEGIREAVSLVSGSEKTGAGNVKVDVDGRSFEALPFKNAAFVGSGKPEADLISAMERGHKLTVRWATKDGESVADVYSLKGFAEARREIRDCK